MNSIIEKINKIKALSEKGIDGEAQAAKTALEKILKRYGITIDCFAENEKKERFFIAKDDNDRTVMLMCFYNFLGHEIVNSIYKYKGKPNRFYINLTDYEFAELSELYNFHKRNMRKEFKEMKKNFQMAYQYKHRLYSKTKSEKLSEREVLSGEELLKILKYAADMQSVSFYKSLSQNTTLQSSPNIE